MMNAMKTAGVKNRLFTTISKHSPEILTAIGIVGMITTSVMAVKATPKAIELLHEKESEVGKLTPIETVKTAWKC